VQLDVTLCRFSCVMPRVHMVTVRDMGVMSRRLVFVGAMMFVCFAMMFRPRVHGVQQKPSCDVPSIFVALYVLLLFSVVV
jgi:hypothetical protein